MEFRPLRRFKQAATQQECEVVLSSAWRGILAVHGENGYPYGLPVNFLYLDGKIYFRLLRAIGAKFFPEEYDLDGDMVKNARNALILEITIDHMSGKHVREK